MGLRTMYHMFVEGIYVSKISKTLEGCRNASEVASKSPFLDKLCLAAIPHARELVRLAPEEGSWEECQEGYWENYHRERLASLELWHDTFDEYIKNGSSASIR